jgi:hypothetical protein
VSKRRLSLEADLRWWPLEQALEHHRRQRGPEPTQTDFNKALEAGALRALAQHADGHRELLLASVWGSDLCIDMQLRVSDSRPSLELFSRKLGKRLRPAELSVFVWRPDYENIFGDRIEPTKKTAQMQEVPEKRGKKPVHDRAELQSVALWLATRQKQGAPQKTRANVVDELRDWCTRNKRKAPADSTLYEIVAAAFRIKPTLKI